MININDSETSVSRTMRWVVGLFALAMFVKVLGFVPSSSTLLSYAALFIAVFCYLRFIGTLDLLSLIFISYIPLSILIAAPSPIFHPWLRFGLFALVFIVSSPLISAEKIKQFRSHVMNWTLILCTLTAIGSFVAYFAGINYMRSTWDGSALTDYYGSAGWFGGLTGQSMLLAPISGIGALASAYMALTRHRRRYWICSIICIGSLLFAASRVSLLATIVGAIVFIYFFSSQRSKLVRRAVGIMLLAIIVYPIWGSAMEGLNRKNQESITSGINLSSRAEKWECRIEEWKDSPVYGIGFASVSDRDAIGYNGMIEPGSSWLAVLSMTGIVGFMLFCALYLRAARRSLLTHTPRGALLGSILVLTGVHMLAEGHIFSGGSFLCFMVWLAIGCATDYEPADESSDNGTSEYF